MDPCSYVEDALFTSSRVMDFPSDLPLKNFPALQQSYDQNDQGNDQKNVDKAAGVEREKPQGP
jgi:hypothetical protein